MSECLSYPDFTVVALYKKLVIGCAFLVPDVGYNEAYVSFMAVRPGWQRAGIATFMLYHLTQTCIGKDITLHVSATNPAICLYQKFGFKIQELILDFYEKYLPYDSTQSRHAFFLRLERWKWIKRMGKKENEDGVCCSVESGHFNVSRIRHGRRQQQRRTACVER